MPFTVRRQKEHPLVGIQQHAWPGNVRELENVISSAAITTTGDFIDLSDLPENLQHRGQRTPEGAEWRPLSLDEVRKVHIENQGVSELRGVATSIVLVSTFPTPPLSQLFLHSRTPLFPAALQTPNLIKHEDSVHCKKMLGQCTNQSPSRPSLLLQFRPPPRPLLNRSAVSTLSHPSTPLPLR